jgi:hypothetical protein
MPCLRTFTAHFIQTPALSVTFVSPFFHILTCVKMTSSFAVVMNAFAMGKFGTKLIIKSGKCSEYEIMYDESGKIVTVHGTAGEINHRNPFH